eukprot:312146-Pyramimonas_sp.AAC.1
MREVHAPPPPDLRVDVNFGGAALSTGAEQREQELRGRFGDRTRSADRGRGGPGRRQGRRGAPAASAAGGAAPSATPAATGTNGAPPRYRRHAASGQPLWPGAQR